MESHANLGNALRQLGRLEEARSAYARAIELVSDNPYLYHNLGEVEALLGNMQGAIVAFEQALAQGTQHEATYAALAVLLRAAGRATEAEDLEEQAKRRGIF